MSKLSQAVLPMLCLCSFWMVGCDTTDELHRPQNEHRTMIIGGVPVKDLDYKLPREDVALNEAAADDD